MRVSAKADYAVRAMVELAAAGEGPSRPTGSRRRRRSRSSSSRTSCPTSGTRGLVRSQRGVEGGYWLARPAAEINAGAGDPRRRRPARERRGAARPRTSATSDGRAAPRRLGRRARQPTPRARGRHPRRRRRAASSRPRSQRSPTTATPGSPTSHPGVPPDCSGERRLAGGPDEDDLARARARACSASSRVSWTGRRSPFSPTSSTRTSKPRWTTRSIIASRVDPFGSRVSSTS